MHGTTLKDEMARIDAAIAQWEQRFAASKPLALEPALAASMRAALDLIRAYLVAEGKKVLPATDSDLLEAFKILARGDPSWNAVRDTLRELVYYQNCLRAGRRDALPVMPEKMAIRLARHLYLYVTTRCQREGRL